MTRILMAVVMVTTLIFAGIMARTPDVPEARAQVVSHRDRPAGQNPARELTLLRFHIAKTLWRAEIARLHRIEARRERRLERRQERREERRQAHLAAQQAAQEAAQAAASPTPASTPAPSYSSSSGGASYISPDAVASMMRSAGFPESVIPYFINTIIPRESGFCPTAVYPGHCGDVSLFVAGGPACGLFQLYTCPGPQAADPATSVAYAYAKYKSSGLSPWGG